MQRIKKIIFLRKGPSLGGKSIANVVIWKGFTRMQNKGNFSKAIKPLRIYT